MMVKLGEFFFGSAPKQKQVPTMSPQQQKLFSQLMQMLNPQSNFTQGFQQSNDLMQQYLDPSSEAVDRFTDPYMREFNEQTIPGLSERFAGMNAMGSGLSSSGFGQALGGAGAGLQERLAQIRSGLGMQAGQQLMNQYGNMSQNALSQRPFGYTYQPGTPGLLGNFTSGYAQSGFPGMGGFASNLYNRMFPQQNPMMANQDQYGGMGMGGY